jgi:hypothetical protein
MNPKLAVHAAMTPLKGVTGIRVTKLVNGERVEVWRYRPTALAASQAAADVKWLRDRWPALDYQLEFGELEDDGVLRLYADELTETEKQLADVRVAAGEYDVPGI